ncbi:MAG: MarR family transcriptional regulator [Dokdonella sp.]|nr:MarR family transcriptional regulator [Dokdonella sp.]
MVKQMESETAPWQDYTARAGGAALGARLRRLSERVDRDLAAFYAHLGVEFEQRWFGVLNLLDLFGPMSIGQLAEALAIRHVSVSQSKDSLEKAGLVAVRLDGKDARRRELHLTPRGRAFVKRMRPVWDALGGIGARPRRGGRRRRQGTGCARTGLEPRFGERAGAAPTRALLAGCRGSPLHR